VAAALSVNTTSSHPVTQFPITLSLALTWYFFCLPGQGRSGIWLRDRHALRLLEYSCQYDLLSCGDEVRKHRDR
jgi:hypothetical protein